VRLQSYRFRNFQNAQTPRLADGLTIPAYPTGRRRGGQGTSQRTHKVARSTTPSIQEERLRGNSPIKHEVPHAPPECISSCGSLLYC
jgi:hypothetical protein